MTVWKNNFALILLVILATSASVYGQQKPTPKKEVPVQKGAGGHGGESVENNGKATLRDLVEKTNCEWFTLAQVGQNFPEFRNAMDSIGRVNWYLKSAFEREAAKIKVCQTEAPLIQIATDDKDGLTIVTVVSGTTTKQMAIRVGDKVYLDMNLFRKLESNSARAYTLLHEEIHSFIPQDTAMRNTKVRSFTAFLKKNAENPAPISHFVLQMQENSIALPTVFEPFNQNKEVFETFINPKDGKELVTSVIKLNGLKLGPLYYVDKEKLKSVLATDAEILLRQAVTSKDWSLVNKLVRGGITSEYLGISPTTYLPVNYQCGNMANTLFSACSGRKVAVHSASGEKIMEITPADSIFEFNILHTAIFLNDESLVDSIVSDESVFRSIALKADYLHEVRMDTMNGHIKDCILITKGKFSHLALARFFNEKAIAEKILKAFVDYNISVDRAYSCNPINYY